MTWLNALLAFALAMVVFCTMVSAITELIQHALARRQQGLQWMLKRFYLDVLRPYVATLHAGGMGHVTADEVERFVRELTRNLAAQSEFSGQLTRRTELTMEELIQRLPRTELGASLQRHIESLGGAASDAAQRRLRGILDHFAQQFQRYEQDATVYFTSRARSMSVVIAIALAFVLNVDALRLFSTFLADEQLTERFVAQAEHLTAAQQPNPDAGVRAPAAPDATTPPSEDPPDDLDVELNALKEQLRATSALGLPIGSQYFPFCSGDAVTDPACGVSDPSARLNLWIKWIAATLLAGALIGLGGPFWFDVFTKLSQVMQFLRAPSDDSKVRSAGVTPPTTPGETRPRDLAGIFTASAASSVPPRSDG